IGIRKNGLGAELSGNPPKTVCDLVESLVPGDANEVGGIARALALGRHPPHGIEHAVRGVNAVQILGDLRAEKSPSHRMLGIALNARGPAILDGDQDSTSVGTIVRAGGMDHLFHGTHYDIAGKGRESLLGKWVSW